MSNASPTRIFVSHSTQDNEWCRSLVAALKAAGNDVWYDEQGLTGGTTWVETLQREVQARDVFVVVLTPEAFIPMPEGRGPQPEVR